MDVAKGMRVNFHLDGLRNGNVLGTSGSRCKCGQTKNVGRLADILIMFWGSRRMIGGLTNREVAPE